MALGNVAALAVPTNFAVTVGPLDGSPFIPCSLPQAAKQITIAPRYRTIAARIASALDGYSILLPQAVEVGSDVARVARRHIHVRHCGFVVNQLRILYPGDQMLWRVCQNSGDINAACESRQVGTDKRPRSSDSGNGVARPATVLSN